MSENRKLTRTTTLRLSEAEAVALREAAAERDMGPSALARVLVMHGIGRRDATARKKRSELSSTIAATLGELGRIGSNVNQLARVANATGDVFAAGAVEALQDELRILTEAVLASRESRA